MASTGQTINDRLNAVRYALVGQGLARTVCKATTEEVLGPKKKHIDYLLACTNEPNVSIPQLAILLIERTLHSSWAVVFKSLITIHHLMSFGNERFCQYLATSNHSFELNEFIDRTTPQGYNMSTFVRRYAKYVNDKTCSYRTLAIDLCKIRSGNDNALRTMNMDNLSKTLPIVQRQFDSLLEFAAEAKDLNNGVITSAFRLLYKDLVRLYVAYQEAIINLLERYFNLSRRKTREALEMYRKYLTRMDKVVDFLKVVDAVGLDKSEMPDLTKSPGSILKILEDHLAQLEAKKKGACATTPVSPSGEPENTDCNEPGVKTVLAEDSSHIATSSTVEKEPQKTESKADIEAKDEKSSVSEAQPGQETVEPIQQQTQSAQKSPPEPPARPAPIRSQPKSTSNQVNPNSEKQPGRPERPAKPPSRPPPPSANAPPQTISSASTSPRDESPSKSTHPVTTLITGSSSSSPVPPPHPPPPHRDEQHRSASPSPPTSDKEVTTATSLRPTEETSPEIEEASNGGTDPGLGSNPANEHVVEQSGEDLTQSLSGSGPTSCQQRAEIEHVDINLQQSSSNSELNNSENNNNVTTNSESVDVETPRAQNEDSAERSNEGQTPREVDSPDPRPIENGSQAPTNGE